MKFKVGDYIRMVPSEGRNIGETIATLFGMTHGRVIETSAATSAYRIEWQNGKQRLVSDAYIDVAYERISAAEYTWGIL